MFVFRRSGVFSCLILFFLCSAAVGADVITVSGFTSDDVQNAINSASAGDIVFLPGGVYDLTGTVVINKSLTIRGAGHLEDIGVVEYGPVGSDIPPYWSETPSNCYATVDSIAPFFEVVTSDGVVFENLKLTGSTDSTGTNRGIVVHGFDNVTVIGCEISYMQRAVSLENSYNNLVKGCYIHQNRLQGVYLQGETTSSGGAQVVIRENEFMANRNDVTVNGPEVSFVFYRNYTHDNERGQPCITAGANSSFLTRGIIRDNIFVRTRPIFIQAGSYEISGNLFDTSCGVYTTQGGYGYSRMVEIAAGSQPIENAAHNIYGNNVNNSGRAEYQLTAGTWDGVTRWPTYNFYMNGVLHEAVNTTNPPRDTSPKPLLGDVYVTRQGTDSKEFGIRANIWYDLHVMATDPQGADDIARIGIQVRNPDLHGYSPGNIDGVFNPEGNYFIETDGDSVWVRKTEGSSDWTAVAPSTQDLFVDTNFFQYFTDGSHRKHFIIRFKLLETAVAEEWIINGYVVDNDGNLPHEQAYENQEGWYLGVEESVVVVPVTVKEAALEGWINMYAYVFDGEDYVIIEPEDEEERLIDVLEGFWVAVNQDNVDLLFPLAETEPELPELNLEMTPETWYMVAVPLDPGAGNRDIGGYFSPALGETGADWQAVKWDYTSNINYQGYKTYPEQVAGGPFPVILPGRGFWLRHKGDSNITVPLTGDIPERPESGYWGVNLPVNGTGGITAHMVGNPFWYPVKWSEMLVRNPAASTHPAAKAVSAPVSIERWHVGIKLEAADGTERDMYNRAGVVTTSGANYKAFRALDFIPPTSGWINVNLKDPSDNSRHALAYDYRAPGQNEYKWELNLSTSHASIPVSLTLDNLANVPGNVSFKLENLSTGESVDLDGDSSIYLTLSSAKAEKYILTASVGETAVNEKTPLSFGIKSASPNPFNPSTTISFELAKQDDVRLRVFTITGQLVDTLVDRMMTEGRHNIVWNAGRYSSGIYLIVVESGGKRDVKSVTLMK